MKNGSSLIPMGEKEYRWLEKGLKKLGFFAKLDLPILDGVLPYMTLVEFSKGRTVCREGDAGDGFYLIYEGAVEVSKKGWDKPIATLKAGEFFGEMALLFAQPRTATVTTVSSSKLFLLQSKDFNRMLKKNPSVGRTIRQIAVSRRKELAQS